MTGHGLFQFWFALVSAFSGQIVFEKWTIGLYNVVSTFSTGQCCGGQWLEDWP